MTDDLRDEHRDPELEPVWADWQAPAPSAGFHARVLREFNEEFGRTPWWTRWGKTRWAVAAALVAAGAIMGVILLRPNRAPHYEPVQQPRFMVVSAGEHP